jgi:biopolymer transport protein TolQ
MEKVAINTSALDAILQASLVAQLTVLLLVMLSVICWSVGIMKWRQLKKISDHNELFLAHFWKASSLDSLYEQIDKYSASTLARVYRAAYLELKKLAEASSAAGGNRPMLSSVDNLERVIRKSTENELSALESKLNWLATTGSTGPFIGLFGTVWGIMSSFHKIGQTGSASLAVVAPGISEALITTAIGLAAAIPAVMLYNHFIAKVRKEEIELNNFSTDFLNIVKRNFFKN